ncbi:MAG: maleylacetoacetate isomerase [Methylacidiphilales bacterium]|nr:maleylacetoacetate isomerase [Candidatus Methylacidiphilales bacterium]
MQLTLYDYFRSTASYRVRIALNLKSLSYEKKTVNLLKKEDRGEQFRKINPQGLIPVLHVASSNVDFYLYQSMAICEWLDEQYPQPPLLGNDPQTRATVRSLCLILACDIHPLNNLRVQQYLEQELHCTEQNKIAWMHHWMREGFITLEQLAPEQGFLAKTSTPSLADIFLVAQWYNALRFSLDCTPYPKLAAIVNTCCALESFSKAYPQE